MEPDPLRLRLQHLAHDQMVRVDDSVSAIARDALAAIGAPCADCARATATIAAALGALTARDGHSARQRVDVAVDLLRGRIAPG